MNNFYKALDYFKRLYRSHEGISITHDHDGGFYWLIDGYTVHKIPENEMELNPEIFKPFAKDALKKMLQKAESGSLLKDTGLIRCRCRGASPIIPFSSDSEEPFTAWFQKKLLDTFQPGITLKSTGPLDPAAVQDHEETIGLILPVRCVDTDIKPFI